MKLSNINQRAYRYQFLKLNIKHDFIQFVALLGCLALAVDAAPAPLPEPVPEPFFGLGLLGRLLAAYSRGEKEEDFGNCKCNRRTFHTKEKDKDKVRSNEQTL